MVYAIFTLYRVAATIIGRGAQAALHIFAKAYVFLLYFVTERNSALDAILHCAIGRTVKKPFKNGQRLIV